MASGLGSLVAIWRKFTRITKADGTPIRAHIAEIRTIADRLTRLGDKPSDALIIATLLGSLPKTYHPLIVALDAHPEAGDLDFVIGRIINEAVTLEHFNPDTPSVVSPGNESMALRVDVRKITCHNCGIVGHFASNCQKQPNPYAKPTKPWDATNALAITETAYAL
ncbi:hypothetical protein NLJ89_g12362 [Agrocybe chaxingu]|uniref:CCHC-type domain-containing protein n=1 Tax=Agrocybe chaxingu TaxID=84603 RepID=A0A9W8JMF9_9AGAR|nr:hypothetical protein NLJ89_g12362 [Agrocybe chaxingu]